MQPRTALAAACLAFAGCGGDDPSERELLLRVFNAQTAIDWPALDALLAG